MEERLQAFKTRKEEEVATQLERQLDKRKRSCETKPSSTCESEKRKSG